MRKLALLCALLFLGCVGSPEPHNPMKPDGVAAVDTTIWWRQPYYGEKDSPWNKYVHEQPKWSDPWGDFEDPELFTPEWIKRHKPAERKPPTGFIHPEKPSTDAPLY